jgi:hypothetical protein
MESKENDPVIDEIREVRHRISAQFGHDPAKLVAHYMQMQEKYKDRLICAAAASVTVDKTSAEPGS